MKTNKISQSFNRWAGCLIPAMLVLFATLTANADEQLYFYHTDHLGTPQVMTDSQGQVVWQAHYQPFGEVELAVEAVESNLRFSGQYFDEEMGSYYNYFRDYDPTTGRYLQSDPIGLMGGINTYTYVGGNPNKYTDQYGLFCIPCAVVVVAVGTGISIWWQNTGGPDALSDALGDAMSSWHDDAEDVGDQAADELDNEAVCPVAEDNGHGPNCQEIVRRCKDKCIEKYDGSAPMSAWLAVCSAACSKARGCSPYQDPSLF